LALHLFLALSVLLSDPSANVVAIWGERVKDISAYQKELGSVSTDYENSVREEDLKPFLGSVMVQDQALYAE
jgi:hypothetical protein